jgi:hypothetical protein
LILKEAKVLHAQNSQWERESEKEERTEKGELRGSLINPCWAWGSTWVTSLPAHVTYVLQKRLLFLILKSFCNTRYYMPYIKFPTMIQHYLKER